MPVTHYSNSVQNHPNPGLGLGLRSQHFNHILETNPAVDWFEIISENFMDSGGRPRHVLRQLLDKYPIVMHGVSMSIGSTDPLNMDYLAKLKALAEEAKPLWVSDHLCWTGVNRLNTHDLLPVILNEESLTHIVARIHAVQEFLQRPLIIENPSSYLTFKQSTIPENEFLTELVKRTGCGLLLDVNNVYVSSFNNEFDPEQYIKNLPHENIVQMHLAGHQNMGTYIIDTHDREVVPEVWKLFHLAWQLTGGCALLLEWDGNIPDFDVCHQEVLKARDYMHDFKARVINNDTGIDTEAAVSNPVHFMVPEVSL